LISSITISITINNNAALFGGFEEEEEEDSNNNNSHKNKIKSNRKNTKH
jgi:hypothetical protein